MATIENCFRCTIEFEIDTGDSDADVQKIEYIQDWVSELAKGACIQCEIWGPGPCFSPYFVLTSTNYVFLDTIAKKIENKIKRYKGAVVR